MELTALLSILVGNVPAIVMLYWAYSERKERMEAQHKHERLLLAVAGYRTEPDSEDIVRIDSDLPAGESAPQYPRR